MTTVINAAALQNKLPKFELKLIFIKSLTWLSRNSPDSTWIKFINGFQLCANLQKIFFKNHYLLVRKGKDAYRKIISFYKDRFHCVSLVQKNDPERNWQNVQKTIFPYLGIDEKKDSREQILEKLNISFVDFVTNILPKTYKKNHHLTPQHWIFYPSKNENGAIFFIDNTTQKHPIFKNVEIIKIEDREALTKFCEKIGYDVNRKLNIIATTNL